MALLDSPPLSFSIPNQLKPKPAPERTGRANRGRWSRAADGQILDNMRNWMLQELPCVAGRRELSRGRYLIAIARRRSVKSIFARFQSALMAGEAVACLMVFPDTPGAGTDAAGAFQYLAGQVAPLGNVGADELAAGASLSHSILLSCPVTGQITLFDDFECIAFCPQSASPDDRLYDPLMAAPFGCVNISSDVYGFSRFVDDCVRKTLGKPAYEETDLELLEQLIFQCVERWQRFAVATISGFESITDTTKCPVHIVNDGSHWVAAHKDPAFAEAKKGRYLHEMPAIYAHRIAERWIRHFRGELTYCAAGIASEGVAAEQRS